MKPKDISPKQSFYERCRHPLAALVEHPELTTEEVNAAILALHEDEEEDLDY